MRNISEKFVSVENRTRCDFFRRKQVGRCGPMGERRVEDLALPVASAVVAVGRGGWQDGRRGGVRALLPENLKVLPRPARVTRLDLAYIIIIIVKSFDAPRSRRRFTVTERRPVSARRGYNVLIKSRPPQSANLTGKQ